MVGGARRLIFNLEWQNLQRQVLVSTTDRTKPSDRRRTTLLHNAEVVRRPFQAHATSNQRRPHLRRRLAGAPAAGQKVCGGGWRCAGQALAHGGGVSRRTKTPADRRCTRASEIGSKGERCSAEAPSSRIVAAYAGEPRLLITGAELRRRRGGVWASATRQSHLADRSDGFKLF